jgi:hypothetical protein
MSLVRNWDITIMEARTTWGDGIVHRREDNIKLDLAHFY